MKLIPRENKKENMPAEWGKCPCPFWGIMKEKNCKKKSQMLVKQQDAYKCKADSKDKTENTIPNQNALFFMKLWCHIFSSYYPEPEFSEFLKLINFLFKRNL